MVAIGTGTVLGLRTRAEKLPHPLGSVRMPAHNQISYQ